MKSPALQANHWYFILCQRFSMRFSLGDQLPGRPQRGQHIQALSALGCTQVHLACFAACAPIRVRLNNPVSSMTAAGILPRTDYPCNYFHEDRSYVGKSHGPENVSGPRRFAIGMRRDFWNRRVNGAERMTL